MKRFLLGIVFGLIIGWVTVPFVKAGDDESPRKYKDYLNQMLSCMRQMNGHLEKIEENTFVLRQKLVGK